LAKKGGRKQQRQLDAAVAAIHRRFGPGALIKGKPARAIDGVSAVPHIPTGFSALDQALGIGGLPKGKLCEMVGPATSGKTTLALKFLAQAQKGGRQVGYIDQALYFDPDYAYRCQVDLSRLVVGTVHDLREALATTESLARSGGLSALVFDALDFLWTDPGATATLAATLNRLPPALARSGMTLLVLHESAEGSSPALSALAHHAAIRLWVVREEWIREQGDIRGYEARVQILKNRMGPAGRRISLAIKFNGTVQGNGL
jgi:recombination protein RecA